MEPADQLSFLPSKPLVINTFEELAKFSLTGADSDVTSVRICPEISTIEIEIEANGLDGGPTSYFMGVAAGSLQVGGVCASRLCRSSLTFL